jgi:transposase
VPLELSAEERAALAAVLRPATVEKRVALRAQAVLLMADAVPAVDIAKLLGVHKDTVGDWRKHRCRGPAPSQQLKDAPRSGRPRALSRKQTASEL